MTGIRTEKQVRLNHVYDRLRAMLGDMPPATRDMVTEELTILLSVVNARVVKYINKWPVMPAGEVLDVDGMTADEVEAELEDLVVEIRAFKARVRARARPYEPKAVHGAVEDQ